MIVAKLALAASLAVVPAHSWYPTDCCSGQECAPINDERVEVLSNGAYVLDGKWTVPRSQAKWSEDEDYHACIRNGMLLCLFVPKSTV